MRGGNRWLRVAVVFAPVEIGLALTLFGGWQVKGGVAAGGDLWLGLGSLALAVMSAVRRPIPVTGRLDFNRHRWLWVPVSFVFGLILLAQAAGLIADWFVPPDRIHVVIAFTGDGSRGSGDAIHSDQGTFRTPLFTGIDPHPRAGPATLIVGHFSHALLQMEQAP